MLSGRLQSGFRQIDTGVNGAMAGKHDSVRPVAGADLEDVFSLPVRKRDQEREVPFGAKSVFAQLLKKISFVRVFFNEMKAAGLGIPERMDTGHCRVGFHETRQDGEKSRFWRVSS